VGAVVVSGIAREISTLPLFDPAAGETPPADAIELYVETPVSLGVYYSAAQEALEYGGSPAQARRETAAILAAREAGMGALLACLRREASYVKVGQHYALGQRGETAGLHLRGQLHVTRVAHVVVPMRDGQEPDVARLHDHVYIGAYGRCADDTEHSEGRGRLWPIDAVNLCDAVKQAAVQQLQALTNSLVANLGAVWEYPSNANKDRYLELIEPPFVDLEDYPRLFCPGPARASACQGPSLAARERAMLAEEPDAREERVEELLRAARTEHRRALQNRRVIVRDVLLPPAAPLTTGTDHRTGRRSRWSMR
jgi:hypothetical protein